MEASALSQPVGLGRLTVYGPLLRLRSDDQLVAMFRAGHDEPFGVIHDRYRARLFAYARQMLGGSRSDAEDVLQDVFLRAYDALRADGRPLSLRAWLYRVAHNRCIDHLRRPTPVEADVFDVNRTPVQDPMAAAERREDLRRLVEDVRRLPEQQRSALLMREMEGLSYNELSDALGVTVPAIKSLLVRARIGLVEAIEARDTDCAEIREDLAAAQHRGVRSSGRAKRHLRECEGCRAYRGALRGVEQRLSALAPGAGPLTTLAKLLGLGGAGSGAGVAATTAGGGGAAAIAGGGVASAAAGKVAVVVAAAAVVGGGATAVEHRVRHDPAPRPAAVTRVVPRSPPVAPPQAVGTARSTAASTPAGVHSTALQQSTGTISSLVGGTRPQGTTGDDPAGNGGAPVDPTQGGSVAPDTTASGAASAPTSANGGIEAPEDTTATPATSPADGTPAATPTGVAGPSPTAAASKPTETASVKSAPEQGTAAPGSTPAAAADEASAASSAPAPSLQPAPTTAP